MFPKINTFIQFSYTSETSTLNDIAINKISSQFRATNIQGVKGVTLLYSVSLSPGSDVGTQVQF